LGQGVKLSKFVISTAVKWVTTPRSAPFVEIQKNATIGKNCKISSHTFICEGVTIEDNVFIGHRVTFINDSHPRATTPNGELQTERDWIVEPTLVKKGASIGSGATILAKHHDRRACADWRGERRDPGRVCQRDCGGQSGALAAVGRRRPRGRAVITNGTIPLVDLVTPHHDWKTNWCRYSRPR